jgi:N-acyl-D-aspartate/D-glutamate deacylase
MAGWQFDRIFKKANDLFTLETPTVAKDKVRTLTFVRGQETYTDGQPTDALPGRLVRGAQPAPSPS